MPDSPSLPTTPTTPTESTTADSLRDLTQSTKDFFARFGVTPVVPETINILREEVSELIAAAQAGTDRAHIAEEAGDVIVTVIGVCLASGVDVDQLMAQVDFVRRKNDAKTHQSHEYKDGKIRRKG